ncbi:secretin receptor, partial [Biomphalaria glabrata]
PVLVIAFLIATFTSVSRCGLTGVNISVERNDNDTCGNVIHIENNNTFGVTANISDGYRFMELVIPAEDIEYIELNNSFI